MKSTDLIFETFEQSRTRIAAVPGSARDSRAGESGPLSQTFQTRQFSRMHQKTSDIIESSFRRAAETSRLAACAPQTI